MITINASVGDGRELITESVNGFSGESNAEMLAVDLGGFTGYDSYAVYVKTSPLGAVKRLAVGSDGGTNPYVADGVMYIRLTSELTGGGRLSVELEGVKIEDGVTVRELTSVAQIAFKPSMASAAEKGEFGGGEETELRLLAAALAKRLTDLENREPTLSEIPLAGENTVGGMKLTELSPIKLSSTGVADYNYYGLNYEHLLANFCGFMLADNVRVISAMNITPSSEDYTLIDATSAVADGSYDACVMTVDRSGEVYYYDENYDTVTMNAYMASLYVFRMKDGAMTVERYYCESMLDLLKNGVVADA